VGQLGFDLVEDTPLDAAKRWVRVRPPREEPYGTVAVFEDLCGNRWDLIQPRAAAANRRS
jgi:hypothetical protein